MKFLSLSLLLLLAASPVLSNDTTVYTIVEKMPFFPGGSDSMKTWIEDNIRYSQKQYDGALIRQCFLAFIVEKDGSLSNIRLLQMEDSSEPVYEAALNVIRKMPNWQPGFQSGAAVRVQYNIKVVMKAPGLVNIPDKDTLYVDRLNSAIERIKAENFLIPEKTGQGWIVSSFNAKSKSLNSVTHYSSLQSLTKDGVYISYNSKGKKTVQGWYLGDVRVGIWTVWSDDCQDSLVVEQVSKENYRNVYVPAGWKYNTKLNEEYKTEVMPQFPDGEANMMKFIQKHVSYPYTAIKNNISGTCYLTFVVEKNGTLTDQSIVKGVANGPELDAEALRVLRRMPDWTPGTLYGVPARVQFNLPIKFTLRERP